MEWGMNLEVLFVSDRKKRTVLGGCGHSFFLYSTFIVSTYVLTFLSQYLGV